ncbi:MAG: putative small protein [Rickettsiaceae bacterium]|jgi:hypothetical protein|nr:putative small protein [Rickettsiaceae bacterium]
MGMDISSKESLTAMEELLLSAVKKIKYGRVEVFVHDSKVVQLETTEKIRFVNEKENA